MFVAWVKLGYARDVTGQNPHKKGDPLPSNYGVAPCDNFLNSMIRTLRISFNSNTVCEVSVGLNWLALFLIGFRWLQIDSRLSLVHLHSQCLDL